MCFLSFFFCPNKRKTETKRKFAGSRSIAKKWRFFLNEKNSLTLKQLFVLHGKISIFLYALPLNAGACSSWCGVNFASLVFWLICFVCVFLGCFFMGVCFAFECLSPLLRGGRGCVRMHQLGVYHTPLTPLKRGILKSLQLLKSIHPNERSDVALLIGLIF